MNTRDIEAFIAVVEAGSMVRAASRLHLTQPGLTRRVQSLEALIGVALLDRQAKPLRPTAAGHEVYELGKRVLLATDDLMSRAARGAEVVGELRLGMPPFLSDMALDLPIDRLREQFPRLTVRVTAGWSPGLLEQVESARLDAVAALLPDGVAPPAHLTARELGRYTTQVVAARGMRVPAAGLSLRELSGHAWVLNQDGCGMRSVLRRALDAAHLPFNVAVEAFGAELQLSLVARGIGIGVVTPEVLARSAHRDAVQVLDVRGFQAGLTAWLLHAPLPRRLGAPLALLFDALRAEIATAQAGGSGARAPDAMRAAAAQPAPDSTAP
ncbi:LysR family transcriptional regulator [Cupriavidus sp. 30B13]|uniref:LysR family transcriptional regulator n=1 Tax=Cupriavidus sp. 30B13 TaxID=3384241 RepID=UPI003B9013B9